MDENRKNILTADLPPIGLIAFSLGTAIGWGSLVVTSSTYLSGSGIAGSVAGMVLGTLVMLIICRNYTYLMQIYPDAGGAYAYGREVFGYDYGFLTSWFLTLTYLSVLWANATSIPLFARYFIGPVFQFGKLYTIFGYDIFAGEIIITAAGIILTALLCMRSKKAAILLMTVLAFVFVAAIVIVSIAAFAGYRGSWQPAYVPESKALQQIVYIAVISPWAFIGFESISHSAEEISFKRTSLFRLMVISVIVISALYILITLLSVTAYPERYSSWLEYIRDRGNLDGIEALPAFYAARHYLGNAGVWLLMAALLSLVITSLIGNTTAVSRLFFALGRDNVLPERFGELNRYGNPGNAILLIAGVSLLIPFVGRTAIGWIVDVTTIGATLIYGFVSAAAARKAGLRNDRTEKITGYAGLAVMIGYGLYTLIPNLITVGTIERETYFLFIVWTILGFVFFRMLLSNDKENKFGKSVIVWVSLLSLVLFIALIWMRQSMINSKVQMTEKIDAYYEQMDDAGREADEEYVHEQIQEMEDDDTRTILMAIGMFAFALVIMFSNHSYLNKRNEESQMIANRDPLTGVKSKHAYLVKQSEMDALIEAGTAPDFAVAVCDVNGLKHINDTYGHKAGDEYICAASGMICEIFQHSPVFRLGGDEFTVILTDHDNDIRAELLQMLHNRSVDNISLGKVVVSGGMSSFDPGKDRDFHTVFERADKLMYQEKMLLKSLGAVTRDDGPAEDAGAEDDSGLIRERVRKSLGLTQESGVLADARDELTNLYKKEYFWQSVAKYDELYADTPMDAVMIDINHFHMVNERFGRDFGDDVLRHVGISVQNYAMKAGGIACRRGADEFQIYCPHRDDYSDISECVMNDSEPGRIAGVRLRIGVYENVDKSLRVGQRFDRAKMAADNVRTGNVNNIGYYDEGMYEEAIYHESLLEDFYYAIENREFEVYFQPKYDIRGEEPFIAGAEALARWYHPEHGIIQPTEFVPVLEDNGRIFDLDRYVWRETAVKIRKLKDKYGFSMPVSVNVSRMDMMSPKIRELFLSILDEFGLTTEDITLEITESAYTNNMQALIEIAAELHNNDPGFRLEVDDVGTGYSSIGLLSRLPIDAFKLDKSFVQGSFGDERDVRTLELIINMAKNIGVSVVAEGVETKAQLDILKRLGCEYVQGFYFSEPLPYEEFEKLIANTVL